MDLKLVLGFCAVLILTILEADGQCDITVNPWDGFVVGGSKIRPSKGTYPRGAIYRALMKAPRIYRRLKREMRSVLVPKRAVENVFLNKCKIWPFCPSRIDYLWRYKRCWIVWPRIPFRRCTLKWCGIGRRCRHTHYVQYRFVLLACPFGNTFIFKWKSVCVPTKCTCCLP